MKPHILTEWQKRKTQGRKSLAVLIDPDHQKLRHLELIIDLSIKSNVDYFFLGGSLIFQDRLEESIKLIRENSRIPVVLFPGSGFQISLNADALLFLSLISGRNPEYLIGKQVEASARLHASSLEVISTGYMLIDGKSNNTAAYISQTQPIPYDKPEIAQATALAGQFLGLKTIFMDAGSGARQTVPLDMVTKLSRVLEVPLVIGGGIRDGENAYQILRAGADVIVVGNAIEEDPSLIRSLSHAVQEAVSLSAKK
ncbi:MAG TPA: geranylgeranylglyceryl/heptaprenylglyceryl phosphate synthase [Saprospiraceae bacterium]|nr:geranylgeranylglyceryl/heptaprenylglyceryl phosphate synthase [Saprospiraceae bacterium]